MRISDCSSDVCSSDLVKELLLQIDALLNADQSFDPLTAKRTFRLAMSANMTELLGVPLIKRLISHGSTISLQIVDLAADSLRRVEEGELDLCVTVAERPLNNLLPQGAARSEEHTSELQSLMRISYAVFCLKTKNRTMMHTLLLLYYYLYCTYY